MKRVNSLRGKNRQQNQENGISSALGHLKWWPSRVGVAQQYIVHYAIINANS